MGRGRLYGGGGGGAGDRTRCGFTLTRPLRRACVVALGRVRHAMAWCGRRFSLMFSPGGRLLPRPSAVVHTLRRQRKGMVQTLEQYFFCYEALLQEMEDSMGKAAAAAGGAAAAAGTGAAPAVAGASDGPRAAAGRNGQKRNAPSG